MYPNLHESPVDFGNVELKNTVVMDVIYYPRRTKFIQDAEKRGAKTITGEHMFLYQGARSFELWTGQKAPVEVMRKVLERALQEREEKLLRPVN